MSSRLPEKQKPNPAQGQGPAAGLPAFAVTNERYLSLKTRASNYESDDAYDKKSHAYKLFKRSDWDVLKAEFFSAVDKDGAYLYESTTDFVIAKWKKQIDRKAALLVIGRYPTSLVPWRGDWVFERFEEHWKHDKRVEVLAQRLLEEASNTKISYSMASLYVDEFAKLKAWLNQLEMMHGNLFPRMVKKNKAAVDEQRKNIRFVLGLEQKLLNLMDQVRSSVAISVGTESMGRAVQGVLTDAINSPLIGANPDRVKMMVQRMTEVAYAKAELYDTKLPKDVIDVEAKSASKVQ